MVQGKHTCLLNFTLKWHIYMPRQRIVPTRLTHVNVETKATPMTTTTTMTTATKTRWWMFWLLIIIYPIRFLDLTANFLYFVVWLLQVRGVSRHILYRLWLFLWGKVYHICNVHTFTLAWTNHNPSLVVAFMRRSYNWLYELN